MSEYTLQDVRNYFLGPMEPGLFTERCIQAIDAAIAHEAELRAENEKVKNSEWHWRKQAEKAEQRIAELEEDNASLYDENRSLAHMPYRIAELEAAGARAIPSFEELWTQKEKDGYQYGRDALEQVRFGYKIAVAAMVASAQGVPDFWLAIQSGGMDDGGVAFGLATKPDDPNGGEVERALVNEYIKDRLVDDEPILCRLAPAWLRPAFVAENVAKEVK
jgi:hypothetical protein